MAQKLTPACDTPAAAPQQNAYTWAVEVFAPELHFDPGERFFPVDLDTTIAASSLYRLDTQAAPPVWPRVRDRGQIRPPDLAGASPGHFTSVTPLVTSGAAAAPRLMPQIAAVEALHANRTIASKLTMYGVVCKAGDVPNAHFFLDEIEARDAAVARAIKDGYLITYFFFFPAAFAPDKDAYYEAEGDWSGISLLFERLPTAQNVAQTLPVLSCYFRKSEPYYITGADGFAKWTDVTRQRDTTTGIDTHPVVYVSRGRHNCYYKPRKTVVPDIPWPSGLQVEMIEAGDYTPNPGGGTITGTFDPDVPEWMFAVFGPVALLFEFCAEMGCVEFDSSGVYSNAAPTTDVADKGGHSARPPGSQPQAGSDTPPAPLAPGAAPSQLRVTPVYVDLTAPLVKDRWAFAGRWGAARMHRYSFWSDDPANKESYDYYRFGGPDRPLLPAWFMWNLFFDVTFGAGAIGVLPSTP
ncbi:MAG: hypothetical protein KDJ88_20495 [Bauldia sp.]|nr:hypothetical protein [Bauldia sp.]